MMKLTGKAEPYRTERGKATNDTQECLQVFQNVHRRVAAGGAHDAASWVRR
jgi:hypothetical protein